MRRLRASTLSGSVSVVHPNRRTSRPKWVSTVMPGMPKRVAEHHIGGLPADAGEGHQVFHPLRHFTAEALGQRGPKLDQGVGLGPEEAGGLDQLLQFRPVGSGVRGGVGIAGEDHRRDQVDALVGALCGQDGGHQQLEWVAEIELDMGVGIGGRQDAVDGAGAAYQRSAGLVVRQGCGLVSDIGGQLNAPPDLLELMPSQ